FLTGQPLTLEEHLVKQLSRIGPVLAVGRPKEKIAPLGFARRYIPDANWKAEVERYIDSSALIIMILGKVYSKDEGFGWEVDRIRECNAARKLVLVIPPLRRDQIRKRWEDYCTHFGIGKQSISKLSKSARLITFTDDWKPRMACASARRWISARNSGLARAY